MARYLLIESRDPFDSNDVQNYYDLAADLAREGNEVTIFLVQNGVLPARPCAHSDELERLVQSGVRVLADEFSMRERGVAAHALVKGIEPAPLDLVVDALEAGTKAIWH